jgi:hypothetical protein
MKRGFLRILNDSQDGGPINVFSSMFDTDDVIY